MRPWGEHREHPGDAGADVGALDREAVVSQVGPSAPPTPARRGIGCPAGLAHRRGEGVAGKRRGDDVEGVGRIATVRAWVRERPDDAQELDRRSWANRG